MLKNSLELANASLTILDAKFWLQINNGLVWCQFRLQFLIIKQKEVFEELHILSPRPLDVHSLEAFLQPLSFIVELLLFPISLFLLKSKFLLFLVQSSLSLLLSEHHGFNLLLHSFFRSLTMLISISLQLVIHSFNSTMLKAYLLVSISFCSFLISFIFFIFSYLNGILNWKLQ